jgi:hypothetical protein
MSIFFPKIGDFYKFIVEKGQNKASAPIIRSRGFVYSLLSLGGLFRNNGIHLIPLLFHIPD